MTIWFSEMRRTAARPDTNAARRAEPSPNVLMDPVSLRTTFGCSKAGGADVVGADVGADVVGAAAAVLMAAAVVATNNVVPGPTVVPVALLYKSTALESTLA